MLAEQPIPFAEHVPRGSDPLPPLTNAERWEARKEAYRVLRSREPELDKEHS